MHVSHCYIYMYVVLKVLIKTVKKLCMCESESSAKTCTYFFPTKLLFFLSIPKLCRALSVLQSFGSVTTVIGLCKAAPSRDA